jgi:hypothetical protein
MMNTNIAKLFGVLVLGGSAIASAQDVKDSANQPSPCRIELKQRLSAQKEKVTCLDDIDQSKTLETILKENPPDCFSPWCGCWLG